MKHILNAVKFIDDKMSENDVLTVAELKNKLAEECDVPVIGRFRWDTFPVFQLIWTPVDFDPRSISTS